MIHRGPDEQGAIDLPHFCAAHNRLSIIDLATGQQPMRNPANGNVIVFNGEIYNYIELRNRLKAAGYTFTTTSDTEVLLKCYDHFGEAMFAHLNGMFAFALYDAVRNEVLIARDRFGEKPLYYFRIEDRIYFASELDGLTEFNECPKSLADRGILEYFAMGYVSGPGSILSGVHQLQPGTSIRVNAGGIQHSRYYERAVSGPQQLSDEEIGQSLTDAVNMRLRADVPVATLLSGGIDSSLITSIAQRSSGQKIHSFAFGWAGEENELPYARLIAERTGTIHHEIHLERQLFSDDIAGVIRFMDMPLADSAAFVVFRLSKSIAEHGVKVVLSGDGGDELFGGYDWYKTKSGMKPLLRRLLRGSHTVAKDYVLSKVTFADEMEAVFGAVPFAKLIEERTTEFAKHRNSVNGRIGFDYQYFLPWMLMPKVDRMSMAHAIEVRAPLLDHTLVDQWACLPDSSKVSNGTTKVRIKQYCVANGIFSPDFLARKKTGMNLPLSWWIRTNNEVFRDVVLQSGCVPLELFGKDRVTHWFEDVSKETEVGWTRSAQKIWTAFIFELWNKKLNNVAMSL